MGCACNKKNREKFLWIPPEGSVDGEGTIEYNSLVEVKAKILRKGGTYITQGQPIPRTARR